MRKISSNDLFYDAKNGIQNWNNNVPYLALLQLYFDEFFGFSSNNNSNSSSSSTAATTSSPVPMSERRGAPSSSHHNDPHHLASPNGNPREFVTRGYSLTLTNQEQMVSKYRNFVLRLIIAYWIDAVTVIHSDHSNIHQWRKLARQVNGTSSLANNNNNSFGNPYGADGSDYDHYGGERVHPSPLDLLVFDPMAFKWTIPTCQSLFLFLFHLQKNNQEITSELNMRGIVSEIFNSVNSLFNLIIPFLR